MNSFLSDVIVIRGAPGVGKSQTAKCLAERLGVGCRIEVDTLRAMIIAVDWTNQTEHIQVLSLTSNLVAGFIRIGQKPIIVVDTFSGDKILRFLAELHEMEPDLMVRVFTLHASPEKLQDRVQRRSPGEFKDLEVCFKLNEGVRKNPVPGEVIIDNSSLTPQQTSDIVLGKINE